MYQVLGQDVLVCRRGRGKLGQGHREGVSQYGQEPSLHKHNEIKGFACLYTNSFPTPGAHRTSGRI